MKEAKQYVTTVDCLRGFAALIVCYYHFTCGAKNFLPSNSLPRMAGQFGYLGVEIFFIISGFILPFSMYINNYSLKNFGIFVSKRLIRLDPPYLSVIILALILNYVSTLSPYYRGQPFKIDYSQLVLHLGYINAFFNKGWINPVCWTLALEFQFYLILSLLYPLIIKNRAYFYVFIVLSLILSFTSESDNFILKYLPFFSLGISCFKKYTRFLKNKEFLILIAVIYTCILIRFNYQYLIAALIPLLIFYHDQLKNKVFLFLGKISYSLYLLHVPIGMRLINITEVKVKNIYMREFLLFVDLALIIFISWIFYKLIEKPSIKLSKMLKYKIKENPELKKSEVKQFTEGVI